MVPDVPIEKDVSCSIPIVTPGLFEAFKDGSIKPVRGTFERYEGDQVVLSNGEKVGCDLAILGVGWKHGIPYLAKEYRDKLIDPDLPDMGFVGFNSSFCSVLSSEMIANWLMRYADGQLANQPSDREMRDNIEKMLDWKRRERPAAKVYGGLCSAPFHFKHFDEVLVDIGARSSSPTRMPTPMAPTLPRRRNTRRVRDYPRSIR